MKSSYITNSILTFLKRILFYIFEALQQLTFLSDSHKGTYSPSSGDGAIYMNNVNCRGTELSVFQCDYQSLIGDYYPCSHSYDAGVYCSCK